MLGESEKEKRTCLNVRAQMRLRKGTLAHVYRYYLKKKTNIRSVNAHRHACVFSVNEDRYARVCTDKRVFYMHTRIL